MRIIFAIATVNFIANYFAVALINPYASMYLIGCAVGHYKDKDKIYKCITKMFLPLITYKLCHVMYSCLLNPDTAELFTRPTIMLAI